MIKKICKHHGKTEFKYQGLGKNRRPRCCICNVQAVTFRRRKVKRLVVEHFGGKCTRCGYNKTIKALAFHHKDPKKKDFGIGEKGNTMSLVKTIKEAKKCILLCSNCHIEIHEEIYNKSDAKCSMATMYKE